MILIYIREWHFDSKITFKKYIRSVYRVASRRLGILRKSWRAFYDGCFRGFVLPVLEYRSEVCSAANTHHKLQDHVVSLPCRKYYASYIRTDVTDKPSLRCSTSTTLFKVLSLACASVGYTCCFGHTSIIYVCASSLQNLIVLQNLY